MRLGDNLSASACMEIHIAETSPDGVSADNDQIDGGEATKHHEKEDFIIALSMVSGKYFVFICARERNIYLQVDI